MPVIKLKNGITNNKMVVMLNDYESVSRGETAILMNGLIPSLLTPKKITEHKIIYSISNHYLPLKEFLSNASYQNARPYVLAQIKDLIKKVEYNSLNLNNLLLNCNSVYVNPQSASLVAIYVPVESGNDNSIFKYIVSEIINNHNVERLSALYEDYHYLQEVADADDGLLNNFAQSVNSVNPVQMSNLENYGETTVLNNDQSNYDYSPVPSTTQSDFNYRPAELGVTEPLDFQPDISNSKYSDIGLTEPLDNPIGIDIHQEITFDDVAKVNDSDNVMLDFDNIQDSYFGITEPLDGVNDVTNGINDIDSNENNYYNSGNTVLLDTSESNQNARLVVNSTGQEYEINKETFYIGSDTVDCDCVLPSGFVSKRQVTIKKEIGAYFAIDNGSTNGTMLNGEKMIPGMRYQLNNDDRLILANEIIDFVL